MSRGVTGKDFCRVHRGLEVWWVGSEGKTDPADPTWDIEQAGGLVGFCDGEDSAGREQSPWKVGSMGASALRVGAGVQVPFPLPCTSL